MLISRRSFTGGALSVVLGSQLAALEPPAPDEPVLTVVPSGDPQATADAIIAVLFPQGGDHEAQA